MNLSYLILGEYSSARIFLFVGSCFKYLIISVGLVSRNIANDPIAPQYRAKCSMCNGCVVLVMFRTFVSTMFKLMKYVNIVNSPTVRFKPPFMFIIMKKINHIMKNSIAM